jgi:hypothetical protein
MDGGRLPPLGGAVFGTSVGRHMGGAWMRAARKILYGIAALVLAFALLGPQPASARGPVCLAVVNTTPQAFSFTVDGWNQLNWTWRPNEELTYVSVNGIDIKSPNADGSFTVRGALGTTVTTSNTSYTFHEELTGGQGQTGTCDGTWVMTISDASQPVAPVPPSDGMNHDHPGSCLYVKNTTGSTITIRVRHPLGYDNVHWDYPTGDNALLASSGVAIKSPDGGWSVTWTNYGGHGSWSYDESITQSGCAGEWVLTL